MNNEIYTSLIVPSYSKTLIQEYNKTALTSLSKLIESASKSLKLDSSKILSDLEGIYTSRKVSPKLFSFYHRLKNAMMEQNAQSVLNIIKSLDNLQLTNTTSEIIVTSIDKSGYQKDVIAKIEANSMNHEMLEIKDSKSLLSATQSIRESLDLIKESSPEFYQEILSFVSVVSLYKPSVYQKGMVGMSDVEIFGDIVIRLNDFDMHDHAYFTEHLIHETSHQYLHALMAFDPLVLNDRKERFSAPIRDDLRPIFGIYHATFVLSRMVYVTNLIYQKTGEKYFLTNLVDFQKKFRKGLDVINQHAKLTENGKSIIYSFEDLLGDLMYETAT